MISLDKDENVQNGNLNILIMGEMGIKFRLDWNDCGEN